MRKAILRKGNIVPLEPFPPEWEEGAALEVAKADAVQMDIDARVMAMNELCADSSPEDADVMRRAIKEHRQQANSQSRLEARP